jgi:hypothetical protein
MNTDNIISTLLIYKQRKDFKNSNDWHIQDLLLDLQNFCIEYGIDFNYELEQAKSLYLEKRQ